MIFKTFLAAAHSEGVLYNWLRERCQRRESDVSSRNRPAQKFRADKAAETFFEEVWWGPARSQRNRFNTFDFNNCARVCYSNQTQAKTMAAREKSAADERKAKHKTNLIFQISLLWNICKALFPGCLESVNLTLLKGEAEGQ